MIILGQNWSKWSEMIINLIDLDQNWSFWSKMMRLALFEKSENLGPTILIKVHIWVELVEFWEKCKKFHFLKISEFFEKFRSYSIHIYTKYILIYIYVHIYIYKYTYVYVYISVHVYMYVYMYIFSNL